MTAAGVHSNFQQVPLGGIPEYVCLPARIRPGVGRHWPAADRTALRYGSGRRRQFARHGIRPGSGSALRPAPAESLRPRLPALEPCFRSRYEVQRECMHRCRTMQPLCSESQYFDGHVCLFDIDGTLIHTRGAGMAAMRDGLRAAFGVAQPTETVVIHGRTDRGITRDLFRFHGIDDVPEHWDRLRQAYLKLLPESLTKRPGVLLPGVGSLLEVLANRDDVLVGLLTGNTREGAAHQARPFRHRPLLRIRRVRRQPFQMPATTLPAKRWLKHFAARAGRNRLLGARVGHRRHADRCQLWPSYPGEDDRRDDRQPHARRVGAAASPDHLKRPTRPTRAPLLELWK